MPLRVRAVYTHKCCISYAYPSISIYHLCVQGRHVCMGYGYMYLCISPTISSTFYLIGKQKFSGARVVLRGNLPPAQPPPLSRSRHRNTDHTLHHTPTLRHVYIYTHELKLAHTDTSYLRVAGSCPQQSLHTLSVLACFSISLRAPNLASSNFPALVTNPFS